MAANLRIQSGRSYNTLLSSSSNKMFSKQKTCADSNYTNIKNTRVSLKKLQCIMYISFSFYPACGGRQGSLVLRHSASHFPPNTGGIACWATELNAAFCLYYIFQFPSGKRTHNLSGLHSHTKGPDWPHIYLVLCI